jgi:hypothetical protein
MEEMRNAFCVWLEDVKGKDILETWAWENNIKTYF